MAYKTRGTKTDYSSDVSDEEWAFCAPYLTLMKEDAPQRDYTMRAIFNAVRYMVRAGCPWRMIPNDLPPWHTVHQQAQRWIKAGSFEAMAHDLRKMLRLLAQKRTQPTAVILDGRTMQSTPESGQRAGYDGYKRRKGSKVHAAVDTMGHLLALKVTAANEQERAQVADLVKDVQEATGENVAVAYVDQGYTGGMPKQEAARRGVNLVVVKLEEAKRGFVLLPKRWVVERSFAWTARFRRLSRDYERLPASLTGLHWLAFVTLMLNSILHQSA
jgi:transposase